MRILAFTQENYPSANAGSAASYVLMHQSMALEELGHEVHYYNPNKHPMGLIDYLQSFAFDLLFLDLEFLRSLPLVRILTAYRNVVPVRVVGALYKLPAPPSHAWEVVDFTMTPWKGETISALAEKFDLRHLSLGYNASLHHRKAGSMGGVFVGDTTGARQKEAEDRLADLIQESCVAGVGPGFAQKHMDPFALGNIYGSARCLPNFHYSWEKSGDCILNERFWQTARCGIPVNDYSPLMDEVFEKSLLERFCFADKRLWRDRVRALNAGETTPPEIVQKLDNALQGHSYHDRMKQLLEWVS
jgi:hypothetical protein